MDKIQPHHPLNEFDRTFLKAIVFLKGDGTHGLPFSKIGGQRMSSENIKSGSQVISGLLDSLQGDRDIDSDTLTTVRELFEAGALSRTRLLSSLAALRTEVVALAVNAGPDVGEVDDD